MSVISYKNASGTTLISRQFRTQKKSHSTCSEARARVGGASLLSKSTHPREFGNHVTVPRPPADRPSAPQESQCLLSHFS